MGLEKQSVKVLIAGDTDGKFAKLIKTITSAHAKAGPFDAVFCVGTFFGGDADDTRKAMIPYLTGQQTVPVPTFFIVGAEPEGSLPFALPEEGCELCKNLTYLGRKGVREIESCGGLKVGFLSGVHSSAEEYAKPRPKSEDEMALDRSYRDEDVQWLRARLDSNADIDFVLTSEWGRGADSLLASSPLAGCDASSVSPAVSEMMELACPRYHFAGSAGVHTALAPYRNSAEGGATRFYGLGRCGNPMKVKALQALGIKLRRALATAGERTAAAELYAKATPNPYKYSRENGGGAGVGAAAVPPKIVYFLPSPAWRGARRGYEYKLGRQGQGYYRTDGAGQDDQIAGPFKTAGAPGGSAEGAEPGKRVMGAEGPPPPKRLFVSGLAWSADDAELKAAFERFGALTEARVVCDAPQDRNDSGDSFQRKRQGKPGSRAIWDTGEEKKEVRKGRSKGFAFVEYKNAADAGRALISMHNASVPGLTHGSRKLKIKPYVAPTRSAESDWEEIGKKFSGFEGKVDSDEDEMDDGAGYSAGGDHFYGKVLSTGMADPEGKAGPARPPGRQTDQAPVAKRPKHGGIF